MNEQSDDPPPGRAPQTYRMAFTGTAGEYFRIWIVNLFLTIVTLGIYLPWAIVRKRKYLYANTWMAEDNFGFHAKPIALLKGYLIVVTFAVIYGVGGYFSPLIPSIVFTIVVLLYPFIIWKAIRGASSCCRIMAGWKPTTWHSTMICRISCTPEWD